MTTHPARMVHISIDRDWRQVHAFASEPTNMPHWASGLAGGLKQDGNDWIADGGPLGEVRVRFTPKNDLGVIDHTVTLPDGTQVVNALRISPNGDGAEVSFTVLQMPGTDDTAFEVDAAHVKKDLETLKALLDKAAARHPARC